MVSWYDIIVRALLLVLPIILTYIFGRLGITKEKYQKYQFAIDKAFELVFAAKDKFPDNSGVQKLAWAVEQLKQALIKAGYHVTDAEAEALIRSAYQQMKADVIKGS